jgi:ThiF family
MFHPLVSHNEDVRRLVEKGYAVAFDSLNYLIVRDIPYLDHDRRLQVGAIVTKFIDVGQDRITQDDHQVFFAGSAPHGLDGKPIPNLGGGPTTLALSEGSKDVVVQRSFSNKPKGTGKFENFYDKIASYVTIISGPAITLHGANPLTFRMVEEGRSESPFMVRDTLTSRAEIGDLAAKFKSDVIAIIGVGGTGAYVLEFLVKTPVKEIRAFDPDLYFVHNTFRSPGKFDRDEIGKPKAEVYQARYENFRTGLSVQRKFIDASSAEDLAGITFAFVCVDKGTSRAGIFDVLISMGIPFIDVGMGLARKDGALDGMLRATYYSTADVQATRAKGLADLVDDPEGLYRTNIQIGELNAINACLAVIRFKQIRGFYHQELPYYHLLFRVGNLKILGDAETGTN